MDIKYQTLQGNILAAHYVEEPDNIVQRAIGYWGNPSLLLLVFSNVDICGLIFIPVLEKVENNFMDTLPTKNTACTIQIINTHNIKTKTPIDVWIETDTDVFSGDMWIDTEDEIKKEYLKLILLL
jgi:hypothetical protein